MVICLCSSPTQPLHRNIEYSVSCKLIKGTRYLRARVPHIVTRLQLSRGGQAFGLQLYMYLPIHAALRAAARNACYHVPRPVAVNRDGPTPNFHHHPGLVHG